MCQDDCQQTGLVFNVQKFSVHDGPGIRTIVFMKGCPLRCRWCSNPESQRRATDLAFNAGRCLGVSKCGHCLLACPFGQIKLGANDLPSIDRSECEHCERKLCVEACPAQSLLVYGKERSVEDVLSVVEQDMAFYVRSKGGLTISGGEPLLQANFALALLREAHNRHIRTAIETCGMVPSTTILEAAPLLRNVLFDIKHMDPEIHQAQTGASNAQILENFKLLVEEFPNLPIRARTPIVPGFNDNARAVTAIAEFLKPFEQIEYEMLPYHRLGTQKYQFLDRPILMGEAKLNPKKMTVLTKIVQNILGERLHLPH